jgi:NAD(P)H-flavin reductase/ferredoxin
MASEATARRLATVRVNGRSIEAGPRETLLQAALRHGIGFPSSRRRGSCGTCRCRVTEGRVKELTETSYLLSAQELAQGYVLACQSVPVGDVSVEVPLGPERRRVSGRIIGREPITHDIVRLAVQLDVPLDYVSGQYAELHLEGLEGGRSYSFATPPSADGRVEFLVRKVPGGRFSMLVNDADVTGRAIEIDGPFGEFKLRPGGSPLLLVAGGSGLAPILAILKQAVADGVTRDATLLFGAREARDLYALEELEAIAKAWKGRFRFVPVLSAAEGDSSWEGERGLVTEKIPALLLPGAHAYLCGPPAMIDGAIALLSKAGVPREHVHFDRFTTKADASRAAEPEQETAGVLDYLKYFLFHVLGLFSLATLLAGGGWITAGLLTVVVAYVLGDAVAGDDTRTPRFTRPWILTTQLWAALPLLVLIVFAAVWSVSAGDPLGFGALVRQLTGHDALAARDATTFGHHVSAWVLTGLMIGLVGTITAHELTHRTWDPVSMAIGRWLLAFSFDTSFAIEHVYGHHRYVATLHDPATAPRGRNVYFHIVASTVKGNVSAWKIEAERLAKKKLSVFSIRNAFLRGHAMSALLLAGAWWMGGPLAAAFFTACALWGKSLLEIVNYMEHYGIVRDPSTPVESRHSWNTNRRISSWTMFNLNRHSHHHAQGEVPYQDLRPYPDAPRMIDGYLTTIIVALVPPLWHALMTPKVLAWDRDYATEAERRLAREANERSGLSRMESATAR